MEPITSYAQNFEDVMLWRVLGHVSDGFYVDIGAQSPIIDSVSMGFFQKGWRGIHVEANPDYASELRNARPGDTVVEAFVSNEPGIATFHAIKGTGLSTFDSSLAKAHVDAGHFEMEIIAVPMVTLDDVLGLVPGREVHWLKVDVEGAERQVIEGWRSDQRPWVVVIESVQPLTHEPTQGEWEQLLLERGYLFVYADGLNRFYLHQSHSGLEVMFSYPPNVFDLFRLSGTATSSWLELVHHQSAQAATILQGHLDDATQETAALRGQLDDATREVVSLGSQLQEAGASIRQGEEMLVLLREQAASEIQKRDHAEEALRKTCKTIDHMAVQMSGILQISLQATKVARSTEAERMRLSTQLFESRKRAADLKIEAEAAIEKLIQCERDRALLHEEVMQGEQREALLRKTLSELQGSHSWRVTAPLRVLSSLARGNAGYARHVLVGSVAQLNPEGFLRRILRKLLPAGSRLGDMSRRQMHAASLNLVMGNENSPRVNAGSYSDLRQLLELTGAVGKNPRIVN